MRPAVKPLSRRTRQRLYLVTAALSLAVWLFMAAAETWTPLHAWLHGGTIPDDDDCAVVAIAHGHVDLPVCDAPAITQIVWIEVAPRIEFSVFSKTVENLLSGRSPPALLAAS